MKSEEEIVKYMYDRWPDEGTRKERKDNLYFRMGFYECYHFVNGKWDAEQIEKKKIAEQIMKKLLTK